MVEQKFFVALFGIVLVACGKDEGAATNDSGIIDAGLSDTGSAEIDASHTDAHVAPDAAPPRCAAENGGCDPLVSCDDSSGTVVCGDCPDGYAGTGNTNCSDIDECLTENGGCGEETCTNEEGSFSCSDCLGYRVIATQADVDAIVQCTRVGGINLDRSDLTTFSLPNLRSLEDNLLGITHNENLVTVSLPLLESVGQYVNIQSNAQLTTVDLGSLSTISAWLSVDQNPALTTIDLQSLQNTEAVAVLSNGLTAFAAPELESIAGGLTFVSNSALASVELGGLTSISGAISVSSNGSLSSLSFPSLTSVTGSIMITENVSLGSIAFENLTTIGGAIVVTTNPLLTVLDIYSVANVGMFIAVSDVPASACMNLTNPTATIQGGVTCTPSD